MPIIKSAKKRVRTIATKSTQNARTKKGLRATLKSFHASLTSGKKVDEAHVKAQSALDTAVKKGVMSKHKAARKKSQLNAKAKAANGGKRTTVAKAKSATSKPAIAKKATTKKPAAKKTSTAKKSTAKK
jgi:small subunit ribosomal protein S20